MICHDKNAEEIEEIRFACLSFCIDIMDQCYRDSVCGKNSAIAVISF